MLTHLIFDNPPLESAHEAETRIRAGYSAEGRREGKLAEPELVHGSHSKRRRRRRSFGGKEDPFNQETNGPRLQESIEHDEDRSHDLIRIATGRSRGSRWTEPCMAKLDPRSDHRQTQIGRVGICVERVGSAHSGSVTRGSC